MYHGDTNKLLKGYAADVCASSISLRRDEVRCDCVDDLALEAVYRSVGLEELQVSSPEISLSFLYCLQHLLVAQVVHIPALLVFDVQVSSIAHQ